MAHVKLLGDTVTLKLSSREVFFGFHRSPVAQLSHVASVEAFPNLWKFSHLRGLRAPGVGIPWIIALGTWRRIRSKDFCAVYKRTPGYVIRFNSGEFAAWVFTAPDIPAGLQKFLN